MNANTNQESSNIADVFNKIELICSWLADKKGLGIVAVDLRGENYLAEGVIMCGATSLRHAQGLADFVLEEAKSRGYEFLSMEGYKNGSWILLDFNDVIVNILQADQRQLYRLEDLYPDSPRLRDERS